MASDAPLPLGEYVELRYRVRSSFPGSVAEGVERVALAVVSGASYEPAVPESVISYTSPRQGNVESVKISYTKLYVVSELSDNGTEPPRYPIPPGTPVMLATRETLARVYGGAEFGVRLGMLVPKSLGVEVRVNPDKLAKHLLIAGATGSGKSNTVAVLADRLSALGAPVVIFDVHGEYNMIPEDGDTSRVHVVEAKINPLKMHPKILASIVVPEPQARSQRRLLAKAMAGLLRELKRISEEENLSLVSALQRLAEEKLAGRKAEPVLEEEGESEGGDQVRRLVKSLRDILVTEVERLAKRSEDRDARKVASKVAEKLEDFFDTAPVTVTGELPTTHISPGRILVVDASTLTDEERRWVLKLIVDAILKKLKAGALEPTVLVVEEAPLFISASKEHPVKESLQRFAREARKFGGCLIVVSQRPRSLDVNVVSQLQNFVFLRMVQQEDIRVVMDIADNLDENLASTIPSLPDGRAIVMGEWVGRFPAVVDIDLHRGKRAGATPPLTETWRKSKAKIVRQQFSLEL
jgi:DNA helicase HerA-like ATPase